MPSEFAKTLNFELDARAPQRRREVIDAALQEVREVLEGLRNTFNCWCALRSPKWADDYGHSEDCLRARALYRRLTPAAQDAAGER